MQERSTPVALKPSVEVPLPPWFLTGVVWDRRSPAAILSSTDGRHQIVVSKGDSVGSIRVEKIGDTIVWLRAGRHRWELALERTTGAIR